ncbi:MAG: methyltransferase domain-containing protein [Planctomycetia bacterium]|nr:methyltransferase domain-containing protein [Planctomycetia bacterium]
MRENVRAFVETAAEAFRLTGPVYEFGAYQVDGQAEIADLRPVFRGQRYIGCDARPGPGVDRVEDLARLGLADSVARTIVCVDTLEHVFDVPRAVEEMIRVLAPGGYLIVAAPMDFRIHEYPDDYWRLTPSCLARLLAPLDGLVIGSQGVEKYPHTVLGVGCKGPLDAGFARRAGAFVGGFQAWSQARAAALSPAKRLRRWFRNRFLGKGERRRVERYFQSRFSVVVAGGTQAAAAVRLDAGTRQVAQPRSARIESPTA